MKREAYRPFTLLNSYCDAACRLRISMHMATASPYAFNIASQATTFSEHVSKNFNWCQAENWFERSFVFTLGSLHC